MRHRSKPCHQESIVSALRRDAGEKCQIPLPPALKGHDHDLGILPGVSTETGQVHQTSSQIVDQGIGVDRSLKRGVPHLALDILEYPAARRGSMQK
jgi:hypothetical protein